MKLLVCKKNLNFLPCGSPLVLGTPKTKETRYYPPRQQAGHRRTPPQGEVSTEGDYPAGGVSTIERPLVLVRTSSHRCIISWITSSSHGSYVEGIFFEFENLNYCRMHWNLCNGIPVFRKASVLSTQSGGWQERAWFTRSLLRHTPKPFGSGSGTGVRPGIWLATKHRHFLLLSWNTNRISNLSSFYLSIRHTISYQAIYSFTMIAWI